MPSPNKYAGYCSHCDARVEKGEGHIEPKIVSYNRKKWILWCMKCYNLSDNSGAEDRECGNRAYEDECSRRVA